MNAHKQHTNSAQTAHTHTGNERCGWALFTVKRWQTLAHQTYSWQKSVARERAKRSHGYRRNVCKRLEGKHKSIGVHQTIRRILCINRLAANKNLFANSCVRVCVAVHIVGIKSAIGTSLNAPILINRGAPLPRRVHNFPPFRSADGRYDQLRAIRSRGGLSTQLTND